MTRIPSKAARLFRSPILSPGGFIARAVLIAFFFVICQAAGWREHTTFLSGTTASEGGSANASTLLGVIYMASYFGFVLLTPILLLAAAFLAFWTRGRTDPPSP